MGELSSTFYTILAAMTPIGELRVAIPLGIHQFDMPWYQALGISLVGNMIPVFFWLWALPRAAALITSFPNPAGRLIIWRAESLSTAQGERFRKYGALALVPLVAVPFPLTGAWTGCLAAWVFGIPPRKALPLIGLGVLIAGAIVTILVMSGSKLADFLL